MTEWVNQITVVCPESLMVDANELAVYLTGEVVDRGTYAITNYQDQQGNRFCVICTRATNAIFSNIAGELPANAPGDPDMSAVARALSELSILDNVQQLPNGIAAYVNVDPDELLSFLNFTRIEIDPI